MLQGLAWCARCDRWMRTVYHTGTSNGYLPTYLCRPTDRRRNPRHNLALSASLLDRYVIPIVLNALSPPGIEAALAAVGEENEQLEANRTTHERLLQHAEDEAKEINRRYRLVDPENDLVRAQLEAELQDALRRRDELKCKLANCAPPPPIVLTPDDMAALRSLAADVEGIWKASTTTNEDRKRLLQTALPRILVHGATDDQVEIEIVWDSGLTERRLIPRPKAVDRLVEELHNAGHKPAEIHRALQAANVPNASGKPLTETAVRMKLWHLGLSQKPKRVKALLRIRELLIQGRSRRDILQILRTEGFPPLEDEWTLKRVHEAIYCLRRGKYPKEIPPLPSDLPGGTTLPISLEAIELMRRGRQEGLIWRAIADELNARAFRPPKGAKFSEMQTRLLYKLLRRRGLIKEDINTARRRSRKERA